MDNAAAMQIARAFRDARASGKALATYPGERPVDLESAYRIQDCAIAIAGAPVVGWKVGRINAPDNQLLGADRLAGPILAGTVRTDEPEGDAVSMPICPGGFAAAEAEFIVRLADRPFDRAPEDDDETLAMIAEIRIGIEIASSPYAAINADGPCVTVSDQGNNAGLVLGPQVPREFWSRLDEVQVTVEIDGSNVGTGTTRSMLDGPLGAVRFLIANLHSRAIAPKGGQYITTGAITGVHEIGHGQLVQAHFETLGTIRARIA